MRDKAINRPETIRDRDGEGRVVGDGYVCHRITGALLELRVSQQQRYGECEQEGERHHSLAAEDGSGEIAQGEGEGLFHGDRVVMRG